MVSNTVNSLKNELEKKIRESRIEVRNLRSEFVSKRDKTLEKKIREDILSDNIL